MTPKLFTTRSAVCVVVLISALLTGCSNDSPQALVDSAKRYIAKNEYPAAVIELKNALSKSPNLAQARWLLGTALIETGDFLGAEKELRRAFDLGESRENVYPPFARVLVLLGDPKQVVERFDGVDLATPKENAELLTAVGLAHLALREPEAARKAISKAIALRPDYPEALLADARVSAMTRDLDGAQKRVDEVLAKSPNHADAHKLKGDILAARDSADAAIAEYRKTLALNPRMVLAKVSIVALLMQQQKAGDVKIELEELKKLAPSHPDTLYLRANYEYQQKNLAAAREAILLHLRVFPNSIRGMLLASAIEFDLKSYAQSEAHLLKVVDGLPQLESARRLLIGNYLRSGQHAKAVEALKPLLARSLDDPATLSLAGQASLMSGKPREAASYFTKAAAIDPADSRTLTGLALSHLAQGKSDDAFRELDQATKLASDNRADLALIVTALERNEFDKALAAINALDKRQPGKALTHNLRGTALIGKRDIPAARKSFEQALAIDPAFFPAAANLARFDLAENRRDDARKRFEAVLAKNPKSAHAILALAELKRLDNAKPQEVAAMIRSAVSANPADVFARLALISHYLRINEPNSAVTAAQEALAALPDRPELFDAAARAQLAAGAPQQALATYSKWSVAEPTKPLPWVRMADVQTSTQDFASAERSLRKALELKPDYLEAQRRLIVLELRQGQTTQAIADAKTVQKQRPKESVGYLLEGEIHAKNKAWGQALAALRLGQKQVDAPELAMRVHGTLKASGQDSDADKLAAARLKQHPDELVFRAYLAEYALATRDAPAAIEHYGVLVERQPTNANWLNNLAYVVGQSNAPKAIEYAEKANTLQPNDPAIMDTLGTLLVESGESARGLELLRKATAAAPKSANIRLNLAKGLIKAGQKDAAKRELEEIAKLGDRFPSQPDVERLLKTL